MSTTTNKRLFYDRDCDGIDGGFEDDNANSMAASSLEIREMALEDDDIDSIVDLLSKGSVKTIHLEDCSALHLNQSAVRLVEALGSCRDVRLSESTFLSDFFLERFLESATQLKNLRIRDHLLVNQVEALSRGLASNKILHTLDLSRSRIDDLPGLAEGLRGGCAKRLKLRSICLRDSHLAMLMTALESSPSPSPNAAASALESLDLSFNRLRNLECIGEFLKRPDCNLKELMIGYQNLWQPKFNGTNIDVSVIASALSHNTRLTTLKLPRNELSDSDAILFAMALERNSTLETLDLRENNLADEGVMALAKAARFSRGLKQLHLRGNPFGAISSFSLLEAVSNNYNLVFVGDNGRIDGPEKYEKFIHLQILYHAALNRGGRKLLVKSDNGDKNENNKERHTPIPLGLWPLILEKQTSRVDWEGGTDEKQAPVDKSGDDMRTDVLYYLLKEGSTIFFNSQRK